MPKLLLLLFYCLISATCIAQTAPTFPDTPTITETSVGKAQVGMSVYKLRELYEGFTFTPTYTAAYGFDGGSNEADAILVSKAGQKLFVYFWDEAAKTVYGLIVLHPAYKTAAGIHVGSTSGQLKAAVPAVRVTSHHGVDNLEIASIDRGEYQPVSLSYAFLHKPMGISKKPNPLTPSRIAVLTAKIAWIIIKPH